MPRRQAGTLLPLELDILRAVADLRRDGTPAVHGFALAQVLREREGARTLTAHGTLYKALGRLEDRGLLTSSWEVDPEPGRPRRRLYTLSPDGAQSAATAPATLPSTRTSARPARLRAAEGTT